MCNPIQRPIHQHDCRGCRFIGCVDEKDFYQCDHIDLCIRWGDSDADNKSLPIGIVRSNPEFYGSDWATALGLYDASRLGR